MKFSLTKNPESDFFFNKESKSNKKKILAGGRGAGVARVSDFSFQKNQKKKFIFFFVYFGGGGGGSDR